MLQKLKKEKKDNYKSHKNKIGGSVDIKNKGIPLKGGEIKAQKKVIASFKEFKKISMVISCHIGT